MKGSYSITVQNKRIRYDFQIRRNITVIRGNSANGKSSIFETAEKSKGKSLLIIADGAALGSEIGKLNLQLSSETETMKQE